MVDASSGSTLPTNQALAASGTTGDATQGVGCNGVAASCSGSGTAPKSTLNIKVKPSGGNGPYTVKITNVARTQNVTDCLQFGYGTDQSTILNNTSQNNITNEQFFVGDGTTVTAPLTVGGTAIYSYNGIPTVYLTDWRGTFALSTSPRTNLANPSSYGSNWTQGAATGTFNYSTVAGPSGAVTARRSVLIITAPANAGLRLSGPNQIVLGRTYVATCYVKGITGSESFKFYHGGTDNTDGPTANTYPLINLTTDFTRQQVRYTSITGASALGMDLVVGSPVGQGFDIDNIQIEELPNVIPNTTNWASSADIGVTTATINAPDGTSTAKILTKLTASAAKASALPVATSFVTSPSDVWEALFWVSGTSTSTKITCGLRAGGSDVWGSSLTDLDIAIISGSGTVQTQSNLPAAVIITGLSNGGWTLVRIRRKNMAAGVSLTLSVYPDTNTSSTLNAANMVWEARLYKVQDGTSFIKTTTAALTVTDYTIAQPGTVTLSPAPASGVPLTWTGIQNVVNLSLPQNLTLTDNGDGTFGPLTLLGDCNQTTSAMDGTLSLQVSDYYNFTQTLSIPYTVKRTFLTPTPTPTMTPTPSPSLTPPMDIQEIDMTQSTIDPSISFTRTTSKSYYDNNGVLQSAAANVWPLEYDPATLQVLGRSVWEQRTNLLAYSAPTTNWTAIGATNTDGVTAPDGSSVSRLVTITSATVNQGLIQGPTGISHTIGSNYAISSYALAGSVGWMCIQDTAGYASKYVQSTNTVTAGPYNNATSVSTYLQPLPNNWVRFGGTYVPAVSNNLSTRLWPINNGASNGAVGDSAYFFGAQVELGTNPSPYIPTTTAAVTRTPDVAVIAVPSNVTKIVFIFSDGTVQQASVTSGTNFTIPSYNKIIKTIRLYS